MNPVLLIVLLFILFIIVMIAVDSNRFVVRTYEVASDKLESDKNLVFLSDLHGKVYGKNNDVLINKIKELKPDHVLIGGDMMTAEPGKSFDAAVDFVKKLKENYNPVYALGNHEYRARIYPERYGTMYSDYESALKASGIGFVDNGKIELSGNTDVYGLTLEHTYYRRFKLAPMDDGHIESLLGERDKEKFSILLAHNPDYFDNYALFGADLVLSGHVHGGVVRIPGFKGVISPMCKLFPKYDGGQFTKGKTTMIVSRGLGMHTIPLRLFNPAEIVFIKLKRA